MKTPALLLSFVVAFSLGNLSRAVGAITESPDAVVIENQELRLMIGSDGKARSLLHKPSGQECLQPEAERCTRASAFSITEYRPYNGDVHLVYPSKETTFEANSVSRVGDDLIVSFERSHWFATIGLQMTENYIGFTLKKVEFAKGYQHEQHRSPIDEVTILKLPVRNRKYFGDWLNVMWDNDVAVNVLATDPFPKIDATKYRDYALLQATAVREVKLTGVGAALIATQQGQAARPDRPLGAGFRPAAGREKPPQRGNPPLVFVVEQRLPERYRRVHRDRTEGRIPRHPDLLAGDVQVARPLSLARRVSERHGRSADDDPQDQGRGHDRGISHPASQGQPQRPLRQPGSRSPPQPAADVHAWRLRWRRTQPRSPWKKTPKAAT